MEYMNLSILIATGYLQALAAFVGRIKAAYGAYMKGVRLASAPLLIYMIVTFIALSWKNVG